VPLVTKDYVPLIIIKIVWYTIDAVVEYVKPNNDVLSRLNPGGRAMAIRKNPHANAVGLELDIQHSCWYII
jgi:hypothetical protein